jgi:hypothetical protein
MVTGAQQTLVAFAAASVLASCHSSNAAGAIAMTSLAGGASAVRRANGECYVDCRPGQHCNRSNGLCESLACNGKCGEGFTCEETETGSACVPRDRAAELASRPQTVVSGAQPFGDGQQVQGPTMAASMGTVNVGGSSSGEVDGGSAGAALPDGGTAIPSAALKTSPTRSKDAPARDNSVNPAWLDSNPWDPRHADPVPQMSNPNQPPPH